MVSLKDRFACHCRGSLVLVVSPKAEQMAALVVVVVVVGARLRDHLRDRLEDRLGDPCRALPGTV